MNKITIKVGQKACQYLLFLICILAVNSTLLAAEKADKTDIRVIIDVSGSMKKNDPENLRVPALKLLVGLLPENVKAGVWSFGTKVKPLVKHGLVDKSWKKKATKSANKIYSADMFTNVEGAFQMVTKDWDESDSKVDRNIIILTDGMVDISKDKSKSQASRDRILDNVIPELQRKGVKVYTISLSKHADVELMDALAVSTDGSSEQVNSADQLQRVFMRMFEKAAPRDTVPLEGNRFRIDKMINEFTLLVFKKDQAEASALLSPSGKKLTKNNNSKDIAWLEEDGYDLITITKPEAGQWTIDADMDPDNRVMIVTNLKLQTSDIPNNVFVGETYDYKVWLTANDSTIKKEAFYKLSTIKLLQTSDGDIDELWDLEQRDEKNQFSQLVGDSFMQGQVELKVTVDGKTFTRENKRTINVYDQFYSLETDTIDDADEELAHQITIKPIEDLIQEGSLKASAKVTAPNGDVSKIKGIKKQGALTITINDPDPGEYKVVLSLMAKTASGRSIAVKSDPIMLGEAESEVAEEEELEPEEQADEGTDWMMIGTYLLIGNAILFGLIGMIWFVLKRKSKKKVAAAAAEAEQGEKL